MAMDIDAAGLPFLQHLDPPAGSKTVEQLKEIALAAGVPFILKGIMTVKGAEKAIEAGAAGIVVSNHGGRVLDDCPPRRRCWPTSSPPWMAAPKFWWTAASAPAATCSRRWPSAQTPC